MHQKELAVILGIRPQTVSYYERGKAQPGLAVVEKMARYFNVSLDYLMDLSDEPVPYSKDAFISLPKKCPAGFKKDLLAYYELLLFKYNIPKK